jgi:hypothetical protein
VRELGDRAFLGSVIESIHIPDNVEKIGKECFFPGRYLHAFICGIESIQIPSSVESLGSGCFERCESLSEVLLDPCSRLKEIGDRAFDQSKVKTIELPAQCEKLTSHSLQSVENVRISPGNRCLLFKDGFLMNKKTKTLIRYSGKDERVWIENFIENISRHCSSLSEVLFGSSSRLRGIGNVAFQFSTIKSIRIPKSVETMGDRCFSDCRSLVKVIFEPGCKLTEISDHAFSSSGVQMIEIPDNVENIRNSCFWWCRSLSRIVFGPDTRLKEFGEDGFPYSGIKSIRIPNTVEKIGK